VFHINFCAVDYRECRPQNSQLEESVFLQLVDALLYFCTVFPPIADALLPALE